MRQRALVRRRGPRRVQARAGGDRRRPRQQYGVPARRDPHDQPQRHRLRRRRRARPGRARPRASTTRCSSRSGPPSTTSAPRASRRSCTSARGRHHAADRTTHPHRDQPRWHRSGLDEDPERRAEGVARRPTRRCSRPRCSPGLLALAVGGLGIANVMSISVIQRSSEIGIRRALGHTRSQIALQFLLEALFVGILGGLHRRRARRGDRVPCRRRSPTGSS